MNTKRTILASLMALSVLTLSAQLKHYVGVSGEFGYSNLLFKVDSIKNLGGVGGGLEAFYELQAGAFRARTGFGFDLMGSNSKVNLTDERFMDATYQTMQYNFAYDKYKEHLRYGVGYVPIMIGAQFNQIYFMGGAKIGLLSFMNHYKDKADMTITAIDEDIIDPLTNMPTHELKSYKVDNDGSMKYNNMNIMLSAEVGLDLDKWLAVKPKRPVRGQRARRKTFKECLHYRAALFLDYGLSDMHNYAANPTASPDFGTGDGRLFRHNSLDVKPDVTPYTMLGWSDVQSNKLNNLMIGVKFAVLYEFQKKPAPPAKPLNPWVVAYLQNTKTQKPVAGAKVRIVNDKTNRPAGMKTSSKDGKIAQRLPAGNFTLTATRAGYLDPDPVKVEHGTADDTLYIYMRPQPIFSASVFDSKSNRPVYAKVEVVDSETGKVVYTTTLDSLKNIATTKLDLTKHYTINATAEGYMAKTDTILDVDNEMTILMDRIIVGRKYILKNMHFATNKTEILPISEPALEELYNFLHDNPNVKIKIIGHTDDIGRDEANQILSEGRAKSVRQSMIDRGISADRIEWEGRGEKDPIVANDSDEHRQMNRRVEIEILSGGTDLSEGNSFENEGDADFE